MSVLVPYFLLYLQDLVTPEDHLRVADAACYTDDRQVFLDREHASLQAISADFLPHVNAVLVCRHLYRYEKARLLAAAFCLRVIPRDLRCAIMVQALGSTLLERAFERTLEAAHHLFIWNSVFSEDPRVQRVQAKKRRLVYKREPLDNNQE